ncbi:MAG: type II secretion system F family protein [Acidimicrobiia bacterium]
MTPLVLGAAWAGLALAAAWRRRPPPARVRARASSARVATAAAPASWAPVVPPAPASSARVGTAAPGAAPAAGGAAAGRRPDVLAALGGVVLAAARGVGIAAPPPAGCSSRSGIAPAAPAAPAGGPSPRAVGAAALAVAASAVVALPLAPLVALAAWGVPRHRARAAERRRLQRLESALPEAVDLLVLAVGAGCNVPLAVAAAGRRGSGPLAAELRRVAAEVECGRRLADALDDLPAVAGEPTRGLAGVLAGCERYGTPVLPALHRLADEVRVQRQRRAEAAARRVPVTLLFPLVVCILPAFALLTVAPLVAGALRELRL